MIGLAPPQGQPTADLQPQDLIGRIAAYADDVERPDVVLLFWYEIDAVDLTVDETD